MSVFNIPVSAGLAIAAMCGWQAPVEHTGITVLLDAPKPYVAEHKWKSRLTEAEQVEWLAAATIWMEARQDGNEGMWMVANVIQNRSDAHLDRRYGDGIEGVLWHKLQFSCWNIGDPNRELLRLVGTDKLSKADQTAWTQARGIAKFLVHHTLADHTGGATYYHAISITPKWISDHGMAKTVRMKHHQFYKKA